MNTVPNDFLELALRHNVLRLGEFTLKSGRKSPYFFNLGAISSGAALTQLAGVYAQTLLDSGIQFDMLFGPAYKGIPLATAVALALAERGHDVPFAYNRKEAKDHGEGGTLVGAPPRGRVVIVDDVVTAGTAVREAIGLLRKVGAEPVALLIAMDRQERAGTDSRSAVQILEADEGLTVIPVARFADLIRFLEGRDMTDNILAALHRYRAEYGA